jgi:outer membrane protein insertion porin family/translocation and assembly module TamA
MRSARLGGGYGTLDCFRLEGEFTHLNLFRSARRFDARARLSKIGIGQPLSGAEGLCFELRDDPYSVDLNYQASMSITEPIPSLFGTRPSATLFRERRSEYKAFLRETRIGLVLSTTRESARRSLTLSYQAENGRTEAQPAVFCALQNVCVPEDREPLLSNRWSGTLSATYGQRWLDDPQYPSKRATAQFEIRHASKVTGSDPSIQFSRAMLDLSGEISVGGGVTFAPRLRVGAVVGPAFRGTSDFIPPHERLLAGGGQTVRGFDQNELGPQVYIARGYDTVRADGATGDITADEEVFFRTRTGVSPERSVPTGGSAVVVANAEVRAPLPGLRNVVQIVGFVDAGELWSPGAERRVDRFTSLKYTPGIGVRVFTGIGAVRVDLAYNPYAERAGAAYFDAPIEQGGQLYCVSPGNTLVVTGLGSGGAPTQASGACPSDFVPPSARGFFRRLNITIAIGQAY